METEYRRQSIRRKHNKEARFNILNLCGTSRSRCGYCHGERLHVMTCANPTIASYNDVDGAVSGSSRHRYNGYCHKSHDDMAPRVFRIAKSSSNQPHQQKTTSSNSSSSSSASTTTLTARETETETTRELECSTQEELTEATTSKSYDVHFHNLLPSDYQQLIDTNWRRSGRHAYSPRNWDSCCPSLPIRLEVEKFRKSRDQRKVEAMMKGFIVLGPTVNGDSECGEICDRTSTTSSHLDNRQLGSRARTRNNFTNRNGNKKMKQNERLMGDEYVRMPAQGEYPTSANTTPGKGNRILPQLSSQHRFLSRLSTRIPTSIGISNNNKNIGRRGGNRKRGDHIELVQARAKNIVIESNLLSILGDKLTQLVRSILQKRVPQRQHEHSDSNSDESTLELYQEMARSDQMLSWCVFKITHCRRPKLQLTSKPKLMMEEESKICNRSSDKRLHYVTVDMVAATSVCAVLHGRSKGVIDKKELGMSIVSALCSEEHINAIKRHCQCHVTKVIDMEVGDAGERMQKEIRLVSIQYHEKSGHVNVHLELMFDSTSSISDNGLVNGDGGELHSDSLQTTSLETKNDSINCGGKDIANKKEALNRRVYGILHEFVKTSNQHEDMMSTMGRKQQIERQNGDVSPPPSPLENAMTPPYKITVKSVPANVSATQPEVHRLFTKYQTVIHNDPDPFDGSVNTNSETESSFNEVFMDDDKFVLESNNYISQGSLKPADFVKFYPQYNGAQQRRIYKNYIAFYRFLCDSPFARVDLTSQQNKRSPPSTKHATIHNGSIPTPTTTYQSDPDGFDIHLPYGFYHQQYRINDKHLIAVGAVDILPNCISSVYAFYDPNLSRTLNLGKVTALREIEWVRRASLHRSSLKFYYLGFYIHSSQKMRYKAEYGPSELLCPVTRSWVDFDIAKRRIDVRSPIRHCCNISSIANDECCKDDSDNVKIISNELAKEKVINNRINIVPSNRYNGINYNDLANRVLLDVQKSIRFMTAMDLTAQARQNVLPFISEFVKEIGPELIRRCVIRWYR